MNDTLGCNQLPCAARHNGSYTVRPSDSSLSQVMQHCRQPLKIAALPTQLLALSVARQCQLAWVDFRISAHPLTRDPGYSPSQAIDSRGRITGARDASCTSCLLGSEIRGVVRGWANTTIGSLANHSARPRYVRHCCLHEEAEEAKRSASLLWCSHRRRRDIKAAYVRRWR